MNLKVNRKQIAQLAVVLLSAFALKQYYSTTGVNQLRWILAPTTFLVELATGLRFDFEAHTGYMRSDHSFVIAASCAGVNFLITAFLMLSLGKLWRDRSRTISWKFIPAAAVIAYVTTLVANTVRIATALWMREMPAGVSWLDSGQVHRFEGIFVYFGFLLLLYLISERVSSEKASALESREACSKRSLARNAFFPLVIYYATTLGIPLANGAFRGDIAVSDFLEHSAFVLTIPLALILPVVGFLQGLAEEES